MWVSLDSLLSYESDLPFAVHRLLMLYQDLGRTGQELRETQI